MTDVIHKIDNMSADAGELKKQLGSANFVIAVTLSGDGEPPGVIVTALAKPDIKTETVALEVGTKVPSLDKAKLTMLGLPNKTAVYCTGGGGNWFWIGVTATDA